MINKIWKFAAVLLFFCFTSTIAIGYDAEEERRIKQKAERKDYNVCYSGGSGLICETKDAICYMAAGRVLYCKKKSILKKIKDRYQISKYKKTHNLR